MNRVDFMNQLESLLQGISSTEREEAIQYYNDYFDDAGKENEQEVIEALGNPARVAENIKRDLAVNGCSEGIAQKVKASDRVLMEYGKNMTEEPEEAGESKECRDAGKVPAAGQGGRQVYGPAGKSTEGSRQPAGGAAGQPSQQAGSVSGEYSRENQGTSAGYGTGSQDGFGSRDSYGSYGRSWGSPFGDYGNGSGHSSGDGSTGAWSQGTCGSYTPEKHKKRDGMPVWAIAMLITVLIFASPVLGAVALGALGAILGVLAGWFGMIFGFGVTAVLLLVLMLVLVVVGIICFFVSPWVGIALVGGGLICGCIGLLFLMLTVAMAGIATPAIWRGIGFVFRGFKRKRAVAN